MRGLSLSSVLFLASVGCEARTVPVSGGADAGQMAGDAGQSAPDGGLARDAGQSCTSTGTPWVRTLFIVDNSSSMADKQARLAAAIPRYLGALRDGCAPG